MKKIQLNYSQLLFLYAYLRLTDLSLDRSRWTVWSDLQDYFKNIVTPSQVIQYLTNICQLPKTDFMNFNFIPEEKSILNKLKPLVFNNFFLKQNEVLYCCKLLSTFNEVLLSDIQTYNVEIEKMRIDIAKFYSDILGRMILSKDLDKLMKVEHYFQNERIETIKLEEFIPKDFVINIGR